MRATGVFEVRQKPETQDKVGENTFGRWSLDKTFSGDMVATSRAEMLAVRSERTGAGAYVAIERVRGALGGRSGTFVLMHNGTMTLDSRQLTVTVVPGCSTDDFARMEGKMTINIAERKAPL
jgi:hypothetical protein